MPFDATLPVANSQILSAELREQFNGLKELIDSLTTQVSEVSARADGLEVQINDMGTQVTALQEQVGQVNSALGDKLDEAQVVTLIESNTAGPVSNAHQYLGGFSSPPTQAECQTLASRHNDLIDNLRRE